MVKYGDLEKEKDYVIDELLDIFDPFILASRIEKGDFYKTNIGTYRAL